MENQDPTTNEERKDEIRRQWAERATTFSAVAGRVGGALGAATDLLLSALTIRPGMAVLDVASGPGEPALSIAAAIAPTGGHVIATDLVPEMLDAATKNADERGVTNVTFQQADAEALPFPDVSFDAVTCRFGVMLFPDTQRALGEMWRVLKPDGQLVCIVWGPREQDAISRPFAVARRLLAIPPSPPPPAGTPHRFRFSSPERLAEQLRAAGFRQVTEATQTIPVRWSGDTEQLWQTMLRMDDTVRAAIEALDEDRRADLKQQVLEARQAEEKQPGGPTAAVILATAVR